MVLLLATLALAGPPPMVPSSDGCHAGTLGQLRVEVPTVERPLIVLDGRLDEPDWEQAVLLCNFTQFQPVEGAPASQPTEVLVLLSPEALYFGVRAFDERPDGIRAALRERDNVTDFDDYILILLDTFHDQRRAYALAANPLGVQEDGLWIEGAPRTRQGRGHPIDKSLDFIWESEGRIHPWGYALEIRIPFKSLRFPDLPLQRWGLNIERRIQRTGFQETWAPLTRDQANLLALSGTLDGLRGLRSGLFLEANPALTALRTGRREPERLAFVKEDPKGELGLNLTYGLTSDLTLDATLNPDFSQVEADASQITANERFAIRLPEKRPFFLEGADRFALPVPLVFTRTVLNPEAGLKVSGKQGAWSVGVLAALDKPSTTDGEAAVAMVRLRRDLGESSTVGVVYTERARRQGGHNRVAGADLRWVLGRRHTLQVLAAASDTRTTMAGGAGESGVARRGSLLFGEIQRSGRDLSWGVTVEGISPGFRAESGFVPRTGDTRIRLEAQRNRFGSPGAFIERTGLSLEAEGFWSHEDFRSGRGRKESEIQLGGNVTLRGRTTLFLTALWGDFFPKPEDYEGLFVDQGPGERPFPFRPPLSRFRGLPGIRAFLFYSGWDRLRGTARFTVRRAPLFDRTLGVPLESAAASTLDLTLNLVPHRALTTEVKLLRESIRRTSDGRRLSVSLIPRVRLQYQFTKALFVRALGEYTRQERAPPQDPSRGSPLLFCEGELCQPRPGLAENRLSGQALVGYQPTPGTVFFLGYSRSDQDSGPLRFTGLQVQEDGLFVKVSYRFRF